MARAGMLVYKTCYACGKRSEQWDLDVSDYGDYSEVDLDGRPSAASRRANSQEMQTCPSCGYTSGDLSTGDRAALRTVSSETYRELWADEQLALDARRYLCLGMLRLIAETEAAEIAASRFFWEMRAAWACEDDGDAKGAFACRKMAVESISSCVECGHPVTGLPGLDFVVIADCLRRSGDFTAALGWIDRGLLADSDPITRVELEYERSLVRDSDTAAHLESETPGLAAAKGEFCRETVIPVWEDEPPALS